MKKLIAATAAAALLVGIAVASASAGADPSAGRHHTTAAGFTPKPLTWHKCTEPGYTKAGFQCATLKVPLNYAKPNGKTTTLSLSRILHTSSAADYKGVMMGNFGGPGGASLVFPILTNYVPNGAGADYDWVGFDPRGVGTSTPLSCDQHFFHGDRPPYAPTKAAYMKAWVKRSKAYAQACKKAPDHQLFQHIKTRDNARDIDSIRKALGVKTISFYGFSYGTYLGQVYATMFPTHLSHLILDSSVDPRHVFYKSNQAQDIAFQKTFDIYFHWLAKYSSVYHVGNTFKAVKSKWIATRNALDKKAAGGGVLGGDELIDDFTSAGYYVFGWEQIASAYSKYVNKGNAKPLTNLYTSANPTTKDGDNEYAVYLGTQCTDAFWPHSQARLNKDNAKLNQKYDYFTWSNAWFNGPCAYWPWKHAAPTKVTGAKVTVPVLMFDETYDAATPFPGSLEVRKLFPTASLIEGKNGSTHAGTLNGDTCDDDAIARYLASDTVPARTKGNASDKICPPLPQPNPKAGSAAPSDSGAHSAAVQAIYDRLHRQMLLGAMMGR